MEILTEFVGVGATDLWQIAVTDHARSARLLRSHSLKGKALVPVHLLVVPIV